MYNTLNLSLERINDWSLCWYDEDGDIDLANLASLSPNVRGLDCRKSVE